MTYKFQNASILVVDDMTPMMALVGSLLEIFGFREIITADNAEDGYERFRKHNPDIILTDWYMEPYDGIQMIEKIRRDKKSPNKFVPVIMMTGYSHKIRVEAARDVGVTEFLVKPFSAQDLYRRIEQLIEKPRKFVDAEMFFGPDRRRKKLKDYNGPFKRENDSDQEVVMVENEESSALLRELKIQAQKMSKE